MKGRKGHAPPIHFYSILDDVAQKVAPLGIVRIQKSYVGVIGGRVRTTHGK
jgi:hypothetical protein